ncbi:hypothetical protein [Streptomyces olivaceiscleroticus]|uniref:Transposase n=1 Tax=Streptomyces olivaceiscleroticus TaxID=68245 RepID=A0ABN1AYM0_9ACTN
MSSWTWEYLDDHYGESLPPALRTEVERIAAELAVVNSMIYLDGASYQGMSPELRAEDRYAADGSYVMVSYLTDVRGERILVVTVSVI